MSDSVLTMLRSLEPGTVLQKGRTKRIFIGFDMYFVVYKNPSSMNKTKMEWIPGFVKWAKGATIVSG